MTHRSLRCLTLAAAALVAGTTSLSAQAAPAVTTMNVTRSNTTGLMLNLHLNGSSLKAEDSDVESGGGFGARVGWGFTPMLTAFVGVDASRMMTEDSDLDYGLGQVDIGAQFNFASSRSALRPFLQAALSGRAVAGDALVIDEFGNVYEAELEDRGAGFTLGGGMQYFFSAPVALDAGLSYTFGKFDDMRIDGERVSSESWTASGARLSVGLSWYPMSR